MVLYEGVTSGTTCSLPEDMRKLMPSRDPNVPHPGMVFYNGCWSTPEAVERRREYRREHSLEYHSVGNRGWVLRRHRQLGAQRARIINQLEELNGSV